MHILTLASKYRKGDTNNPERRHLDFIISEQALSQYFESSELDLIGTFGWTENKVYESEQLDQFLGLKGSELKSGRVCFYVCPICGDIGCGAITAVIEVTDTSVIWKDFGYETDDAEPDRTEYKPIGP